MDVSIKSCLHGGALTAIGVSGNQLNVAARARSSAALGVRAERTIPRSY